MSKVILDASAFLALINNEKSGEKVEEVIQYSVMSSVNISEVLAELNKKLSIEISKGEEIVNTLVNEIVTFDFKCASKTAELRKMTQSLGLSIGDRACLSLGILLNLPIYTADKAWQKLNIPGLKIVLIR